MEWDEEIRTGLETALNEADVLGLRLAPSGAWCEVLVHVLALPEAGPLDRDARRVLRLTAPGQVSVLLRATRAGQPRYGPVIPLRGLDEVEDFFASLDWSGSMYGWEFIDRPSLAGHWPEPPSLTVPVRPGPAAHSLYWFNECGRTEVGSYLIEGTVTFQELDVTRADGRPQRLDDFIADGQRHWQALSGRDERLSSQAQRTAQDGTPSWRPYVHVPGSGGSLLIDGQPRVQQ